MANESGTTPRLMYGLDEVAEMLSIKRTSVYHLVNSGHLQLVKIGRRSVVPAESLGAYVQRLTGAAGEAEGSDR